MRIMKNTNSVCQLVKPKECFVVKLSLLLINFLFIETSEQVEQSVR